MSDPIGFNLTNYFDHPEQPGWVVFRFPEKEQMRELEQEFVLAGIRCEVDQTQDPPFLIAVRQSDRSKAIKLNYTVIGRHRDPMIKSKWLGLAIVLIVLGLILIALVGWWRSH